MREVPTYKTIVEAFKVPLSDSPRELFNEQWMAEHPTKYNKDGQPQEFPVKPNLKQLKEKVSSLEAQVAKLEKLVQDIKI